MVKNRAAMLRPPLPLLKKKLAPATSAPFLSSVLATEEEFAKVEVLDLKEGDVAIDDPSNKKLLELVKSPS